MEERLTGEPGAVKACAVVRTKGIAIEDSRSSEQMTPRRTTNLYDAGEGTRACT